MTRPRVEPIEVITPGSPECTSTLLYGAGVLAPGGVAEDALRPWLAGRTAFFVSSPPIRASQGHRLAPLTVLPKAVRELTVADGEAAKDGLAEASQLWQQMLEQGGKRDSRLLAFGGGTVGDLGGFVAACFLRGIEYAQVPTTLLAQVDAAIGGKTAVDVGGKNTVGAFHHPRFVLADTAVLATLPRGELVSGLVEVVKMAALLDPELFARCERELPALLAADAVALEPVVREAARAKCRVVAEDPTEQGLRRVLNFGHTLAHAVEKVLDYQQLRHGEAVAYGLLFALRLCRRLALLEDDLDQRLALLLRRLELPALPLGPRHATELLASMGQDKKASEAGVRWCLARGLGQAELDVVVAPERVAAELAAFLRDPWALRL